MSVCGPVLYSMCVYRGYALNKVNGKMSGKLSCLMQADGTFLFGFMPRVPESSFLPLSKGSYLALRYDDVTRIRSI